MKKKRRLSGIFFRSMNEETGKWENVVFEDLSKEQQDKVMDGRSEEWVKSLAKKLAEKYNEAHPNETIVETIAKLYPQK